jgi:phosphoesterase RecJ-like protein
MSSESAIHQAIWESLTDGLPVVVTSHVRLDGDGIGSALALCHALGQRGVDCRTVFEAPVPPMFDFLPGVDGKCCEPGRLPANYKLVVIDCGTLERIGEVAPSLSGAAETINIDHHDSNAMFGDHNYVDPGASSCGEMIRRLLGTAEVPIDRQIADCLFTAIVSDTGQFSHRDTTAQALSVCAECVEAGARPDILVRRLFMSPSPAQVRLRQLALATLNFHCGGSIATMDVTEDMFRRTGLTPVDTEGFAEIPISIQGVRASALLKEMPACGYIKVSLRSREGVDVCEVARLFGGGGHRNAAGCEIPDGLEDVRRIIVEELQRHLDGPSA